MSDNKSKANNKSVKKFIESIEHDQRRADALAILQLMETVTPYTAKMWGDSMVGFGSYHYRYDSGREGDWFVTGFSPRKQNTVVYVMPGFSQYDEQLAKLGKYKKGKSCLYINKLADIDTQVLSEIIQDSIVCMREKYDCD